MSRSENRSLVFGLIERWELRRGSASLYEELLTSKSGFPTTVHLIQR
jgi:hypothetical protein